MNIRDPTEEKICRNTTKSACDDSFYNSMDDNFAKEAEHWMKITKLDNELTVWMYGLLTRKNQKGEGILRNSLEQIKANPNCDY